MEDIPILPSAEGSTGFNAKYLPDGVLAMTVFLKPPGGTHPEPQGIAYIPEPNRKERLETQAVFQLKRLK